MGYEFRTLDGRVVKCSLLSINYPMRSEANCRSRAQYRFGRRLLYTFAGEIVLEEFIIPKEHGLSLDFYIPRLCIAFEVDGHQHDTFVPFMHGDRDGFQNQKARDSLKAEWCDINRIRLIRVSDKDVDDFDILGAIGG